MKRAMTINSVVRRPLLAALLAMAVAGGANAETWTYSDCLDYALSHNISLEKLRLSEVTGDYDLEAAEAAWYPTLDFSTRHAYTNTPMAAVSRQKNVYSGSVGLDAGWTLYDGGIRQNNIKAAKLRTSIDKLATEDKVRSLQTDLLQVYMNILYARENIEICKEAVNLSQQQADRAEQLMKAGKLSKVDYAQLKAQLEQDNYDLVNAEGTYNTRRMELKKLLELGITADISLVDVDWTVEQILAQLPDMEQTYEMALKNDAQLQGLDLESQAAEIAIKTAKAGRLPQISLSAGVGTAYTSTGSSLGTQLKQAWNENIGLSLTVPIFDNKKNKVAIAKANIDQLNANLDIQSRQNDLAQEVENWYIDVHASQARYKAAQEQVEAATVSNEYVNEQFKLGLAVTVELVNAHNTLLDARHSLIQAKYMTMLGKKMIGYYRTTKVEM